MSAGVENNNGIKKTEVIETKSDWDDDDWDQEWVDAEDNSNPEAESESGIPVRTNHGKQNLTSDRSAENEENPVMHLEHPVKSSWGNVWKPFGGVLGNITDGLGTITTTMTRVIGVPDPEELARINAAEELKAKERPQETCAEENKKTITAEQSTADANTPAFGLSLVTTLGTKVLHTGLDTLEGIGKKTMDILQENDPLLMNKRKLLGLESEKPNLSEVLQEAKKDAEELENTLKALRLEKNMENLRFEPIFENNCGLVHLEALEILSKESALKISTLLDAVSGHALLDLQETINEVKELMELEELEGESDGEYGGDELNKQLMSAIEDVDLKINFDDIIKIWTEALEWLSSDTKNESSESEIYVKAVTTLAETSALEMNKLHKVAELLLVKEHHSTANEVDSIVQLCKQFIIHIHGLVHRYGSVLSVRNSDAGEAQLRKLFEEMFVAVNHIEKAFKMFLPIMQIGAV